MRQQDPLLTWPLFCPTDWVHLNGKNLGRGLIQKSAIVRCDEHAALKIGQVFLKPQVCIKVQVVGWLVKEQEIGLLEQNSGQACAHDQTTAELTHWPEKVTLLKAKAGENRLSLMVAVVSTSGLQSQVKLDEAVQQIALAHGVGLR